MSQFPTLFSEAMIGQAELKNRIVMPSMGTNFTADRTVSQKI